MGYALLNPNRRQIALLTLKARLELEIKVPSFRHSRTGLNTMRAVKGWGFKGRTRDAALKWVISEMDRIARGEVPIDG